uniref:Uncharacterized protein n=1 Tax=Globodera rostochiensis TaxID=31243 RepID=A0A914HPK8_GLORO
MKFCKTSLNYATNLLRFEFVEWKLDLVPMHCFASAISILIILFSLTIAKKSVEIVEDDEFLAFVKDPSNFWQCKELEERNEVEYSTRRVFYGFKKMREFLVHKSEASLGVLFLMRQNWQCAKIVEQIKGEYERTECHKFRKYLDILYEYLFRVYVGGMPPSLSVDSMLAQQFAAVKPIFKLQYGEMIDDGTLFDAIYILSSTSNFFFNPNETKEYEYSLKRLFRGRDELKLLNEEEFELNAANSNGTFRQQFDRELKRMAKATKKREGIMDEEFIELKESIKKRGGQMTEGQSKELRRLVTVDLDKFSVFNSSPFNDSIILLDDIDLLLALFHNPPTFYEILKMAKKLGEMDNDFRIFLNSSDLKRIFKRLNRPEEPIEKIEIQIQNEFCALAYFVDDLLKMANIKNIPNIEKLVENGNLIRMAKTMIKRGRKVESIEVNIENFLEKKKELCKEKQKTKGTKKYLDGKGLYNDKTPKVDSNSINDLKQIVPEIVEEIEQMLQKSDWNYANLKYLKMDEWNLLEFVLHKVGNDQKWEEIDKLRVEWEQAFSNWWKSKKNEKNRPNFEEMMGNLIKTLSNIGKINDSVVLRAMERAKIA